MRIHNQIQDSLSNFESLLIYDTCMAYGTISPSAASQSCTCSHTKKLFRHIGIKNDRREPLHCSTHWS